MSRLTHPTNAIASAGRLVSRVSPTTFRSFSAAARQMSEGDTGAPRSGGSAQSDAFTKREQASEDYTIRQREAEKLKALREKIRAQEHQLEKDKQTAEAMAQKQK
ncbi:hypothetical protein M433DRAFT_156623 [Acidomyces richmondensis BFW]|nr:MAG: hypothetical protein FE78DRAFT_91727 [Acidomyces sp. 'richmondensis']KYG43524.1 hypothetical protein M433DRAFT_156623 [Acidomyces richmondensis BFW]